MVGCVSRAFSLLVLLPALFSLRGFAQVADVQAQDPLVIKKLEQLETKRKAYYKRERQLFTSASAYQAEVEFDHFVEIKGKEKPTKEQALNQIDQQLFHLFGPLGENEDGKIAAVPRGDYDIDRASVKITPDPAKRNLWRISYHYAGVLLVEQEGNHKIQITLPRNPTTIYKDSVVINAGGKQTYPCTDSHYFSKDDFWYFWNPENPGCKLEPGVNYDIVENIKLKKLPNEKRTYPNYRGLINDEGTVRVSVLMGMDEPTDSVAGRNPFKSKDINALTYKRLRKSLTEIGFESDGEAWSLEQIQEIAPLKKKEMGIAPYVETLSKVEPRTVEIDGKQKPIRLEVRLFFGPSGISETEEGSRAFHYFYKDALEKDSVVVYDGHSGLGGHLDLASIEEINGFKIKIPKDKHQIYFFNSCSSYTYYNLSYLERKGGAEFLDIMVNGLATAFDVLHGTNMKIIEAIDLWANNRAPKTYQAMAKSIDSGNLFAINGDDEGNPTTPEEI